MTQRSFLPESTPLERHKAELRRKAERRRLLSQPCDLGLFGSEHLQTDLVELTKGGAAEEDGQPRPEERAGKPAARSAASEGTRR